MYIIQITKVLLKYTLKFDLYLPFGPVIYPIIDDLSYLPLGREINTGNSICLNQDMASINHFKQINDSNMAKRLTYKNVT